MTEAQIRAHLLADVGEQLMGHFVNAAKEAGASRSAIGEALGVSKQAAQQRGRQFFAGFTKRAAHAVVLAQDAARIRRSTDIGTEHLLLGLLEEQEGLAARIVVRHAGSPERAEQAVAGVLRPDGEVSSPAKIPFAPTTKSALEQGARAAKELGHGFVGTEHLLLGLLEVGDRAGEALVGLGLDAATTRDEVRDEVARMQAAGDEQP